MSIFAILNNAFWASELSMLGSSQRLELFHAPGGVPSKLFTCASKRRFVTAALEALK